MNVTLVLPTGGELRQQGADVHVGPPHGPEARQVALSARRPPPLRRRV